MSRRTSTNAGAAFVLSLLVMPVVMVIYGSTLAKLWEWFVADTFGVLALSTAQAIGLSSVVTFVTYQEDARSDRGDDALERLVYVVILTLFRAVMALAIGAVVKGFI
jgi:hypothetical protein